jgi:drug/metabolite transporter (DMT)-like permease
MPKLEIIVRNSRIFSEAQIQKQSASTIKGLLIVILATICWSFSGLFITLIMQGSQINPIGLAFWRDLFTSLILVFGLGIFRRELLKIKILDLPWLILMGMVSIGTFHVLWNITVMLNGVSIATVIQCNAPIFVTIIARIVWKEDFTINKIFAILLATTGTILIAGIQGFGVMKISLTGLLVGLLSAIAYGSTSLIGKKLSADYSTWTIITYAFGFAALALMPLQVFNFGTPLIVLSPVLIYFLLLILISTITGYKLYTTALSLLPASVASIASTAEVFFAALFSFLLLGQTMDMWQIMGAILVVSGVVIVSLPQRKNSKQKILEQSIG